MKTNIYVEKEKETNIHRTQKTKGQEAVGSAINVDEQIQIFATIIIENLFKNIYAKR